MTLSEILSATGAVGDLGDVGNPEFSGVATDSRAATAGRVFVCIPGARFDGHHFAAEAVAKGAGAVLADRPMPELAVRVPVLLVKDTVTALGRLAGFWRRKTAARVVAVTGSAGKTTIKELLAAILSEMGPTSKNYKNFNNLIGLPLSILEARETDAFWVMELGVSLPGEMRDLATMIAPDMAVVVNVGKAHLEGLGDVAGVAREKCELLRHVRRGGGALAGMDHPELWIEARRVFPGVYGMSSRGLDAPFTAAYLGGREEGGRFVLRLRELAFELELPYRGGHFAEDILAAAAAAHLLGAGEGEIRAGLAKAAIPEQRFCCRRHGCFQIVDDSYNANPLSMRRAVEAAAEMALGTAFVPVLGEMRELGSAARDEHVQLGEFLAAHAPAAVFFHGESAPDVAAGLAGAGYAGPFFAVASPPEFLKAFAGLGLAGGVVLFKGSRTMRMEAFAQALCGCADNQASCREAGA
ncbi:UDP-N-acetylmuramoyl-tripeptide--D-alanyl-D-alanine ligase [Desulfolutivibrio sulfoxidireducens]|uniref:UDP-N-acetylmuramoyl-tripeptide--D-alanyl-D- alanine ligase n=1 Tax=Desulfolutivibrio sulfoxidireducens TaxID=2773299 RepID=UPI001FEA0303|nr:UDP-N-acetylmuramoyl-tripeptide--D-alanyl-D-alanine ligase [Desulfolutivibrio sulfoxidireducens]